MIFAPMVQVPVPCRGRTRPAFIGFSQQIRKDFGKESAGV